MGSETSKQLIADIHVAVDNVPKGSRNVIEKRLASIV